MTLSFKQGDIIWFDYPGKSPQPQIAIRNSNQVLILHDDTLHNQTIIIAPLASLHNLNGSEKELKSYHLKLFKREYPQLLGDSYVKLDQIMTFPRSEVFGTTVCSLNEKDIAACHFKLMESLQMYSTISEITTKQIQKAVEEVWEQHIKNIVKSSE